MTLRDFAKSKDPNGAQAQAIEMLEQYNPMLQDAPAYPANAPYGNRTTYRRSLPSVGTVKINKGVSPTKSTTDQRVDTIGIFSGRSEVDSRIGKVEGTAAMATKRRSELNGLQEAMAQLVAQNLAYGDTKLDEASFTGLAPRMASLNAGASVILPQVWSSGTVTGGDGCSVYIVDWGEYATKLIYPPNTIAGMDVADKGEEKVTDAAGGTFYVLAQTIEWFIGLSVEDPRHIGRLANIDLSDALLDSPTQGVLFDRLEQMMDIMPAVGPNQRVMYCPNRLYSAFRKQARAKSNLALTMEQYLGELVPHLWNVPVRKMDQLTITETTVS
jgi:hypothetical protein